jgi:RNA polymerase sigma-70 factor (ECF subfamily)
MSERDKELMLRVRGGDMAAFEELYARYSRPLLNFFYRLTWDRAFSEDLMQEAFFRLWKGRGNYRPTGKFTTYLFQIAKNHWLNERDKKMRRIAPVSLEAGGEVESNGLREAIPTTERGPMGETLNRELAGHIARAVEGLSEKLRLVFVLGQLKGLRYADIAEILEIPVGTVKSRMANAEKAIRGRLSAYLAQ